MEECFFEKNAYIVRQGARGDTFYIISKGNVKVTMCIKDSQGVSHEQFIRTLSRGDFFGEKALQGDEVRTANIICDSPEGVTCLAIDRETFKLISNLEKIQHPYDESAVLDRSQ